ncbi:MAG: hypothetical protein H0T76_22245 [Nannocystis sp.]|nr:hypothetical protein [Nannocystis sp.]MBA3549203.1 hypothetical protein [Nannocystis sp.]
MNRSWTPLSLLLVAALPACGSSPIEGSGTDTESSSGSSSASTDPSSATDVDPPGACVPGKSNACACPSGGAGAQVCKADASGFGACECTGATTDEPTTNEPTTNDPTNVTATTEAGTTTDASTTTGGTTEGTTDTTGEPGTSTGVNAACNDVVTFELEPDEATISGDWKLAMSMLGEGQIINLSDPMDANEGSILYQPDIPCDDTWYIWARILDQQSNDSYLATLDGQPNPAAIFEGDCTQNGNGYKWAVLNWRDSNANSCDYVEDPWAPVWAAGVHDIEFQFREAVAMGRILITNDPDLVPAP